MKDAVRYKLAKTTLPCNTHVSQPVMGLGPKGKINPKRVVRQEQVDENTGVISGTTFYSARKTSAVTDVFDAGSVTKFTSDTGDEGVVVALADGCGHPSDEGMAAALHEHADNAIDV